MLCDGSMLIKELVWPLYVYVCILCLVLKCLLSLNVWFLVEKTIPCYLNQLQNDVSFSHVCALQFVCIAVHYVLLCCL